MTIKTLAGKKTSKSGKTFSIKERVGKTFSIKKRAGKKYRTDALCHPELVEDPPLQSTPPLGRSVVTAGGQKKRPRASPLAFP
ncbi:MAG TPA: hypothetical protein VK175_06195 [Leadbetterella sp.]|nr:hypothetical protein [Leadbetterella sp.]